MSLAIRKVLVATDFSECAETAIQEALALARRKRAELVVFHAYEPGKSMQDELGIGRDDPAREARDALDQLHERISPTVPGVSTQMLAGAPADAICEAAVRLDADVVVLGTHGRTGFRRILLGSVAERVTRYSERAVLVARAGDLEHGYRSIMAATDFSPAAERALRVAAELAATNAAMRILHYYSLPSVTSGPEVARAAEQLEAIFEQHASAYEKEVAHEGLSVEFQRHRGSPSRGLLEALDTGSYDLVALGHSRHVGARGHTIGTVAETVVRHARCSALVVPATSSKSHP